MSTTQPWRLAAMLAALALFFAAQAFALDPRKGLTQYSRTAWSQGEQGLPQDNIRAITQTQDGYLWVGTDEGLARFDGYEFKNFPKGKFDLPSSSITALAADPDGTLWVGTAGGLVSYRDERFKTYTTKSGLPDDTITALFTDHAGTLWIVAGAYLSRFQDGKFTNYRAGLDLPLDSVRVVCEDRRHDLWVVGYGGVAKLSGGKFERILDAGVFRDSIATAMAVDGADNLWVATSLGLLKRSPDGRLQRFTTAQGLPDPRMRAILSDRDGGIWGGTDAGLARLESNRFVTTPGESGRYRDPVYCLFEDREGDLWVGTPNGLVRYRDDIFTAYGKSEGLPSDEPNVVFQDHLNRIWIGFREGGLYQFSDEGGRQFSTRQGLPGNEIFSIRETRSGDLLIGLHGGLVRMHGDGFHTYSPPDKFSRVNVYDALESSSGEIWVAGPGALFRLRGGAFIPVIPGGPVRTQAFYTLLEDRDGSIWAGTAGRGLWRIRGGETRLFTTADGLSSDQIHTLYQDRGGALWIGTFDGGLDLFRDGKFHQYTEREGLLSDNVGAIADDGESLWLSTTRGICRVPRKQFEEMAAGKRRTLQPTNYGVEDGLRSAQCAPATPAGAGGVRTRDGHLWFTTSRGIAVFDPKTRRQPQLTPTLHLLEMIANDEVVDLTRPVKLPPDSSAQFRYSALHLSAPEQVQYYYKLENVDRNWISGSRRVSNYTSLHHGRYRFLVRALLPGGATSNLVYDFEILPHFYERAWFRVFGVALILAAGWGLYVLRLRQIRSRFALVLEERARLAREIHDTLAQGFVGISSQLDAVAMCLKDVTQPAWKHLDIARKMARHSLTEARRSVMDLRASALEGQDLASALESGARVWTAGSPVAVHVDVEGEPRDIPQEAEQHLLRIAQEAVTNALKHSGAEHVTIRLLNRGRTLHLRIEDDGRGFEPRDVFSALGGHFGLIGMRERAERLGGELQLESQPGQGTRLEITVPLP